MVLHNLRKPRKNYRLVKLDIDEKVDLVKFFSEKETVIKTLEAKIRCLYVAETKKGYHVILEVKSPYLKNDRDQIFFQLILGSDPVREALNWRRLYIMDNSINVLFNKKEKMNTELIKKLNKLFKRICNWQ